VANLVTIEDQVLRSMTQDPRFIALLPCLQSFKQKLASTQKGGRNCLKCTRKKNAIKTAAFAQAKQCIKNTKGAKLSQLKALLNAKQLRVITRNGAGKPTVYTV